MRFKGTVTLFTALIVVGGYVYFTEFYHKEERQKQEQSKNAANPKKTGLYTKILDSNEVFLTAPPSARTFTKTLSDLRNKKLLEFEAEDIDGVKIVDKAKEIQLQKSADSWQLTKPVNTNAEDAE